MVQTVADISLKHEGRQDDGLSHIMPMMVLHDRRQISDEGYGHEESSEHQHLQDVIVTSIH